MATTQTFEQKREHYQERVRAEMDKLDAQITELRAKADQAKADARIEYNNQLENLRTKQAAAEQKLKELQNTSESAWSDIQAGFENAWNELQAAFDRAASKFNQ